MDAQWLVQASGEVSCLPILVEHNRAQLGRPRAAVRLKPRRQRPGLLRQV